MQTYQDMLKAGIKALPEEAVTTERFEIPKAKGHVQGTKTVIINLNQIITALRRKPEHFTKFLLKELATPGRWDGPRFVFARKLTGTLINSKITKYAEVFVFCYSCGKPDTTITKDKQLKCQACGKQAPLKG